MDDVDYGHKVQDNQMAFDIRVLNIATTDGGGERRFVEQLRRLPNDYIAIVGCVLGGSNPGEASEEYDAIVIGPNGIFVFEVKNWARGWTGDARFWWRGTERMPSPIATARRKWVFLQNWLRSRYGYFTQNGPNYWTDYGVVLTHPTVDTKLVNDPSKDKYLFSLNEIVAERLNVIFRQQSAKLIEGYYDARQIADKIAPESSREVLAIDFGTSYSLVGMYTPEGSTHIFADPFNRKMIPSVFGYQNKKEFVGRQATNALSGNRLQYSNYVASIKTFLGLTEDEYAHLNTRAKPSNASFDRGKLTMRLDRKPFTAVEIAAKIIGYLKHLAEEQTARKWTQAVISVPARFSHEQRSAVCSAARLAGFEIVSLIDEPTAAALAFGLVHQYEGCLAVYDLGGGTFDFSIVEITRGACRERVKLGKLIGGDDFDHRLMSDCTQHFRQSIAMEAVDDLKDRERFLLSEKSEQAKVTLSGDEETTLFLDNWRTFGNLEKVIKREQFEVLITDLVDQTLEICSEALVEAGSPKIKDVLLVGGSTFIPLVRKQVSAFFNIAVRRDVDANTAIVHGAAIKAGILMGRVKNAYIMTRLSPVTIGIPTAFVLAWWSPAERAVQVEAIGNRCGDQDIVAARERLIGLQNEKYQSVEAIRAIFQSAGVRFNEIADGDRLIFLADYEILYPLIGRNDQIECDGDIVEFKQTFPTTEDGQMIVPLSVLETDSHRTTWKRATDCRVLERREIRLSDAKPAGQNGIEVIFRIDRDGRLHVSYSEQARPRNASTFVVEVLYHDHSLPVSA